MLDKNIDIQLSKVTLTGNLNLKADSKGLIILTYQSGRSKDSPRNYFVAEYLQRKGFGTLVFDLLTPDEDRAVENRLNVDMLTERFNEVLQWIQSQDNLKELSVGLFGTSTAAATEINSAVQSTLPVKAIVSRGGRLDMAYGALPALKSPLLCIVGENDNDVLKVNKEAITKMDTERQLEIVPNATHLFDEPGAIEEVARLSYDWFEKYLVA